MQTWSLILSILLILLIFVVAVYLAKASEGSMECWATLSFDECDRLWPSLVTSTHVITLEDQHQKQASAKAMLDDLRIPFTFWKGYDARKRSTSHVCPKTNLRPGQLGCSLSHLTLLKSIQSRNGWTLVFEDDALPSTRKGTKSMMIQALQKANLDDNIWIVYFGGCFSKIGAPFSKRVDAHLWKMATGCTHAFAVKNTKASKIADIISKGMCKRPVDLNMLKYLKKHSLFVCHKPYNPANPWAQFYAKTPEVIYGSGLFGQRRNGDGFKSVISTVSRSS